MAFFGARGELIGTIATHVDDFLIAGNEQEEQWRQIKEQFRGAFRWSPWEEKGLYANWNKNNPVRGQQDHHTGSNGIYRGTACGD